MNFAQRTDRAVGDHLHDGLQAFARARGEKVRGDVFLARGCDHLARFKYAVAERLVHDDVQTFVQCRDRDGRVQMVGRHHLYRGDVFFLIEQLTEIDVGRASLEAFLAALLRIIRLDDFLADVAPAGRIVESLAPRWIFEQQADRVSHFAFVPFEVIDAVFLDIAHRDDLHFGTLQYPAYLAYRLRSEADARERDLLAGRYVAATNHVTRHNADCGNRGPACLNEFTP